MFRLFYFPFRLSYYTPNASLLAISNSIFPCSPLLTRTTSTSPPTFDHYFRSSSRFSLKIARFMFSRRRLKPLTQAAATMTTHAHYSKNETADDMQELARDFVLSLEPEHRRILQEHLIEIEKTQPIDTTKVIPSQLAVVFIETGLPYLGFGFVDNFIMLVAGDTIETFFGAAFCLSTMAAAALGNAVSDVFGIGLADRIERLAGGFLTMFGINPPKLNVSQWASRAVHITQLLSKIICIFVGCLLGMCPLLFRNGEKRKTNEETIKSS